MDSAIGSKGHCDHALQTLVFNSSTSLILQKQGNVALRVSSVLVTQLIGKLVLGPLWDSAGFCLLWIGWFLGSLLFVCFGGGGRVVLEIKPRALCI